MTPRDRVLRLRRRVAPLAGPVLIVAGVLTVLHHFAFEDLISRQYPDVLPFWLPTYCFLGKTLAAGHIAAWNPHVMGGVPFAADPQSGWMYAPAMALFAALPCSAAIRWFVVLNPLIAGLGLYAFLRGEELSRPGATVGGLVLAMPLAGSYLVLNLPFAGTMAWTAVTLACASRYLRAVTWPGHLLWAALAAIAWMQIAASNLSDGLIIGTGAVGAYVVARLLSDLRSGRRTGRSALGLAAVLVVAVPLVGLAYFLPRLVYLPRTSIALGYRGLYLRSKALSGPRTFGLEFGTGVGNTWPVRLALSPGVYLGASALTLMFAGWRATRQRAVAVGFAGFGVVCYVLMLQWFAHGLPEAVRRSSLAGFYFHDPSRFRFGLLIALAVLAGVGLEAWQRAGKWWERVALLAPGVVVWFVLPKALGAGYVSGLLWFGAAGAAAALLLTAWRAAFAWLVPVGLVVELIVNGLAGQAPNWQPPPGSFPFDPLSGPINTLLAPTVPARAFAGPTALALRFERAGLGRYLSSDPSIWEPRGWHVRQKSWYWGFLGMQQSMLFDRSLEEGQGYNPAQELRYWSFVRAVEHKSIRYNGAAFLHPPAVALNLLQVVWIVDRTNSRFGPPRGTTRAFRDGQWSAYRVRRPSPRASVVSSWRVVGSADEALAAVRDPAFDPNRTVVVEGSPGLRPGRGAGGTAAFRWNSLQRATVRVRANGPSIVLIRDAYDPNWHATVDGRPAALLAADAIDQGVRVSAGAHVIELRYDDPWIRYGLAGSALTLLVMAALAERLRRRGRRAGTRTLG